MTVRPAEFRGERTGTAPLTWGQRSIWDTARRLAPADHFLNVRRVLSLSERAAVGPAAAVAALGALVGRHEALRTRIRLVGGEPQQVLDGSGRFPVEVVPVAPDADPARLDGAAQALRDRLAGRAFDYAHEWPLRAGVVTRAGLVRRVALAISHLSVDGHATDIVLRDLRLLLLRGASPAAGPLQPLDIAGIERTRGEVSARALRHWTVGYGRLPPTMLAPAAATAAEAGQAGEPRYQRVLLTSTALDRAARVVAARHAVGTATVYLAATAAVLRDWTGHPVCGLETLVHNRFRDGYADVVGTLVQTGLCTVDVGDAPALDVLVPRVFRAALDSYRNAYYHPPDRDAIAERFREPGAPYNPYGCFNDVRVAPDARPGTPRPGTPRPGTPRPGTARTGTAPRFEAQPAPETMHCRLCVEIHDVPDGVGVLLTADTRYLPPADMREFLRRLERTVVTPQ